MMDSTSSDINITIPQSKEKLTEKKQQEILAEYRHLLDPSLILAIINEYDILKKRSLARARAQLSKLVDSFSDDIKEKEQKATNFAQMLIQPDSCATGQSPYRKNSLPQQSFSANTSRSISASSSLSSSSLSSPSWSSTVTSQDSGNIEGRVFSSTKFLEGEDRAVAEVEILAQSLNLPHEIVRETYDRCGSSQGETLISFLDSNGQSASKSTNHISNEDIENHEAVSSLAVLYPLIPPIYIFLVVEGVGNVHNLLSILQAYYSSISSDSDIGTSEGLSQSGFGIPKYPNGWSNDHSVSSSYLTSPKKSNENVWQTVKSKKLKTTIAKNKEAMMAAPSQPEPFSCSNTARNESKPSHSSTPTSPVSLGALGTRFDGSLLEPRPISRDTTIYCAPVGKPGNRKSKRGNLKLIQSPDAPPSSFLNLSTTQVSNYLSYSIDLHKFTVEEGLDTLRIELDRWWSAVVSNNATHNSRLTIVTGRGKHSSDGVSRMFTKVNELLRREGWIYDTGVGHYVVKGLDSRIKT